MALLSMRSGTDSPYCRGYDSPVVVRLAVVDPQPFFCEAVGAALDRHPGLSVVGWTTDELEAAALVDRSRPDVVLTEVDLRQGSGLSLSRRLAGQARTVVLTRGDEGDVLLDAVAAGTAGCLSHRVDVDALVDQVERVAGGEFALDAGRVHETLLRASASRTGQEPHRAARDSLTPRERQVLGLLVEGLDDRSIASELHVSRHTVRTHLGNVLRKLGVHSRAEAVRIALGAMERESGSPVLRLRGPDLSPP
jgi:DNA-binding NarL/FixJ family response regulator